MVVMMKMVFLKELMMMQILRVKNVITLYYINDFDDDNSVKGFEGEIYVVDEHKPIIEVRSKFEDECHY